MSQIIMALDQGTTSSRTILFDENGIIVAEANASLGSHFPQSGWVEQVPEDIWSSQRQTIEAVLAQAKLSMKDINA
ncbi:MAG TPA: glycerol kinase, partial [Deltaproteobacteria bacterium]|nr:glycerol kinase [Deltaproteobacteria bacterium]